MLLHYMKNTAEGIHLDYQKIPTILKNPANINFHLSVDQVSTLEFDIILVGEDFVNFSKQSPILSQDIYCELNDFIEFREDFEYLNLKMDINSFLVRERTAKYERDKITFHYICKSVECIMEQSVFIRNRKGNASPEDIFNDLVVSQKNWIKWGYYQLYESRLLSDKGIYPQNPTMPIHKVDYDYGSNTTLLSAFLDQRMTQLIYNNIAWTVHTWGLLPLNERDIKKEDVFYIYWDLRRPNLKNFTEVPIYAHPGFISTSFIDSYENYFNDFWWSVYDKDNNFLRNESISNTDGIKEHTIWEKYSDHGWKDLSWKEKTTYTQGKTIGCKVYQNLNCEFSYIKDVTYYKLYDLTYLGLEHGFGGYYYIIGKNIQNYGTSDMSISYTLLPYIEKKFLNGL